MTTVNPHSRVQHEVLYWNRTEWVHYETYGEGFRGTAEVVAKQLAALFPFVEIRSFFKDSSAEIQKIQIIG